MHFPDPAASLTTLESSNDNVKSVLNASRPYGATPILGMLSDAEHYFTVDATGPVSDPYRACREQYIILLTDGAPNLDLRP